MNERAAMGTRRLYRMREGRVVAGVCAGLCAWVVIPEEGEVASIAETFVNKQRRS